LQHTKMWDFPPIIDFLWTAIGDAILLWINNILTFSQNTKRPWIIILITDGDSNKWSDPIDASKVAANNNIPIYVIAIWNSNYIVWKDYLWMDVPTKINLKLLKQIADISWWKFYRVTKTEDFEQIINDIKNIAKTNKIIKIYYIKLNLNKYLYLLITMCLTIILIFKLSILFKYLIYKNYED
jgi:hypothetical protein